MGLFPYLAGVLFFMLYINDPQPFWLCGVVAAVAVVPGVLRGWFCTSGGQVHKASFAQAAGTCTLCLCKWSFMHEHVHLQLVQMEFRLLS